MSRTPHVVPVPPLPTPLPTSLYGTGDEQVRTVATVIAENIGAYPGPAAVVLRSAGEPRLAVVGWFTDDEAAQVRAAIDAFVQSLDRLRYVDYAQAEADCAVLADRLRATLSPDELETASFVGIPRGGLIVLGMLGYELGLAPEQFGPPVGPDTPLVVVDDCFLTGSRVARFLDEQPHSSAVLAALYAPPALCDALERERTDVRACVHARSLTDHAPALYGDNHAAWAERWAQRATGRRYWHGVTDHLCFAWSEPDGGVWTPATQRTDRAWTTVPAAHCLKTRTRLSGTAPIHVQPDSARPFAPAPAVVAADLGPQTIIAHIEHGTVLPLDDTAAAFWRALRAEGSVAAAHRTLLDTYDVAPAVLRADLQAVADALLAHDLVVAPTPTDTLAA